MEIKTASKEDEGVGHQLGDENSVECSLLDSTAPKWLKINIADLKHIDFFKSIVYPGGIEPLAVRAA